MKNGMLKKILAGMLAASVVVAMPLTASAAWKQTGNVWQWTENGQNATGWRWIQGAWYHFNASGDMTKGWLQENGTWYYLKGNGSMAQGWNLINGKWYCLNSNGSMRTGWVQTKGIWYFLAPNGDMQTGVVQVDGKTYCLDESGAMKTGKVEIDGKTYTFDENGAAKGTAPKADKAFSTTSGSAATVPVKEPSRPSGGGSSGGGNGGNDSDNGGGSSEVTADITKDTTLDTAFFAETYDSVTINLDGMTPPAQLADALDLTKLKVKNGGKVTITGTPATARVRTVVPLVIAFGPNSYQVSFVVGTSSYISIAATENLEGGAPMYPLQNVEISAANAQLELLAANVVISSTPVTLGGIITNTMTVSQASEVTGLELEVNKLNAAALTTLVGEINIDTLMANADVTLQDDSDESTPTAPRIATVDASTGKKIIVESNAVVIEAVLAPSGSSVGDVIDTTKAEDADVPTDVATKGTVPTTSDYTIEKADAESPTEGIIKATVDQAIEIFVEGGWELVSDSGNKYAPGTYEIRKAAIVDDDTGEVTTTASDSVPVTIGAHTGFDTDHTTYYVNSVPTENGWTADGDDKYYVGEEGAVAKNEWVPSEGNTKVLVVVGADGKLVADKSFDTTSVSGGVGVITGTKTTMEYAILPSEGEPAADDWKDCSDNTTSVEGMTGSSTKYAVRMKAADPIDASIYVTVTVTAPEVERSVTVTAMTTEDLPNWNGIPSADKMNLGYTVNGNTIKADGELEEYRGFTDMGEADEDGYFVAFNVALPSDTEAKARLHSETDGPYKNITPDNGEFGIIFKAGDPNAVKLKNVVFDIDWDGDGTAFGWETYTVDMSAVTMKAIPVFADQNAIVFTDVYNQETFNTRYPNAYDETENSDGEKLTAGYYTGFPWVILEEINLVDGVTIDENGITLVVKDASDKKLNITGPHINESGQLTTKNGTVITNWTADSWISWEVKAITDGRTVSKYDTWNVDEITTDTTFTVEITVNGKTTEQEVTVHPAADPTTDFSSSNNSGE